MWVWASGCKNPRAAAAREWHQRALHYATLHLQCTHIQSQGSTPPQARLSVASTRKVQGRWRAHCHLGHARVLCIQAFLNSTTSTRWPHRCALYNCAHCRGPTYYVAADVVDWNYAAKGNQCFDTAFMQPAFDMTNRTIPTNIGGTFKKAAYRQYTDSSFTVSEHTHQPSQDPKLAVRKTTQGCSAQGSQYHDHNLL